MSMQSARVAELVARKGDRMQELLRSGSVLFPGALEFIREAAAAVPIAIASARCATRSTKSSTRRGWSDLFATIVAAGDTPESKPSPAPYLLAFERSRTYGARARPAPLGCHRGLALGSRIGAGRGPRLVGVTNSYPADELAGAELVVNGLHALTLPALDELCAS